MADGVMKVVNPFVFGRSRQLLLNKFFDLRKGRDGKKKLNGNNGENSSPLTPLPVDRSCQ